MQSYFITAFLKIDYISILDKKYIKLCLGFELNVLVLELSLTFFYNVYSFKHFRTLY